MCLFEMNFQALYLAIYIFSHKQIRALSTTQKGRELFAKFNLYLSIFFITLSYDLLPYDSSIIGE